MVSTVELVKRKYWIFDMDGTLTVAAHDFDAIRSELGLPQGLPILEQLAELPADRSDELHRRLGMIELEVARLASPSDGSRSLLDYLKARGSRLGIVTRNSRPNALVTLEKCGLSGFFEESFIVGREIGRPKPSPEGIQELLGRWKAAPEQAVMVGDFRFDVLSGRAAGTATVWVTHGKDAQDSPAPDLRVRDLDELGRVLRDEKRSREGQRVRD